MIVGAFSYIFFGTADVQYYNDPGWREKTTPKINKVARAKEPDMKQDP